ncbi:unnamed protein product, partial [Amoebophrya sp. A120]|eukprot:GSA120T00012414001.1
MPILNHSSTVALNAIGHEALKDKHAALLRDLASTEKELKRVESSPAFFIAQEGEVDVVDHAETFPQRAGSSGGLSSFSSSFSSNKNPIPQNRALQILQQQALESGLFKNPAFVKKERIRWQSLTVEEQQAQYDAICAVVQNFKNWLEGCEEKKSFSGGARARLPTSRSASTSNGARDEVISGARSRNTNIDDKYTSSQKEERALLQEHGKSSHVEIATSYPRGREKLRDWINELYESGLELLNETGSVLFIFTTLRPESDDDHDGHQHGGATEKSSADLLNDDAFLRLDTLYALAVFTFVLSLCTRLFIASSNYPEVDKGYTVRSDLSTGYLRVKKPNEDGRPDQRGKFFAAVVLYLVEPNSGKKMISSTFRRTREFFNADGTSHEMHPLALEYFLLHTECKQNIRTILAVILLADFPELIIEFLYAILLLNYSNQTVEFGTTTTSSSTKPALGRWPRRSAAGVDRLP